MPILGLTSAQAKLARWLIKSAGQVIPAGLAWLASDLTGNGTAAEDLAWRRFHIQWTRSTPVGTVEDRAQFKLDLLNITSDEVDLTWTSGDYTAVRAAIQTFLASHSSRMAPSQSFAEVSAYTMKFNPVLDVLRPFVDTGPPVYRDTGGLPYAGSQTGSYPYQIAPTVTMRTAWPKHWGRAYLPTPGAAAFDANGRLTSTWTAGTGTAWKTMLGTLHDAGFYPVIPVGQLDKQPFHGLLGVTTVVVDDVPDIQRRRRAKQPAFRTVA